MPYTPSLIQTVTVGIGIAPIPAEKPLADYTAGGELRPAPKTNDPVVLPLSYTFFRGIARGTFSLYKLEFLFYNSGRK